MSTIGYWPTAIIALPKSNATCPLNGGPGSYCQACVTREAELIECEAAIIAEEKRLANWSEELASTEENLEVWSDRLYGIEHDLKIREQAAELKESWLKRVFRKR